MRSDQYVGLTEDAQTFIDCNNITGEEECGTISLAFSEETIRLTRYHLEDGRIAEEFLQAEPWDAGPQYYIGLRVSDGTEYLWTNAEMNL